MLFKFLKITFQNSAIVNMGKKCGRRKYKNLNIFRAKKSFLMKQKAFFIIFLSACF